MMIANNSVYTLRLGSIYQARVYGGLLEGLPTKRMNLRIIEYNVSKAGELFGDSPVHLIDPVQREIEYEGEYPFGEPAELPSIVCAGLFTSKGIDPTLYRTLIVVWFQEKFAMPVSENIVRHLNDLNWEGVSVERDL